MEYISTTSLAAALDTRAHELFSKLESFGWIDRINEKWILTDLGKEKGGELRTDVKFGEYIVWPENISIENEKETPKLVDGARIAKHFDVLAQRLNLIISELSWVEKDAQGWSLTKLGKTVGGKVFENEEGKPYLLWPEIILENTSLREIFGSHQLNGASRDGAKQKEKTISAKYLKEKFEAMHRTLDGHYVGSREEVIIDDLLYHYGLLHAYERKIIIADEEIVADFYLPGGKVYIEFSGTEVDVKGAEEKTRKLEFYKKKRPAVYRVERK